MGDQKFQDDGGEESGNSSGSEKESEIEIISPGSKFTANSSEFIQSERNQSFVAPSRDSIDQSNVTLQPTKPSSYTGNNLLVNPPFPPNIDPKDLAIDLLNSQKKSNKLLNEFFIYRKEFVRELKRQNLHPKQTKVSTLA